MKIISGLDRPADLSYSYNELLSLTSTDSQTFPSYHWIDHSMVVGWQSKMFLASYIEYYTTLYVFTHQLTYISINLPLILTRFYFRNNPNNKCYKMFCCLIPYFPIIAINIVLYSSKQVVNGYFHHILYHIMKPCGTYVLTKHSLDR